MYLFVNSLEEKNITLALFDDINSIDWFSLPVKGKSSENVLLSIDKVLRRARKEIKDIQGIIVINGPGSFVGIRIALSVSNTLAYLLDVPVIGVNLTEAASNRDLLNIGLRRILKLKKYHAAQPFYAKEPNITVNVDL